MGHTKEGMKNEIKALRKNAKRLASLNKRPLGAIDAAILHHAANITSNPTALELPRACKPTYLQPNRDNLSKALAPAVTDICNLETKKRPKMKPSLPKAEMPLTHQLEPGLEPFAR
jgi:hypothetical protein